MTTPSHTPVSDEQYDKDFYHNASACYSWYKHPKLVRNTNFGVFCWFGISYIVYRIFFKTIHFHAADIATNTDNHLSIERFYKEKSLLPDNLFADITLPSFDGSSWILLMIFALMLRKIFKRLYAIFFMSAYPVVSLNTQGISLATRKRLFFPTQISFARKTLNTHFDWHELSTIEAYNTYISGRGRRVGWHFHLRNRKTENIFIESKHHSFIYHHEMAEEIAQIANMIKKKSAPMMPRLQQSMSILPLAWIVLFINSAHFIFSLLRPWLIQYQIMTAHSFETRYGWLFLLNLLCFILPYRWQARENTAETSASNPA